MSALSAKDRREPVPAIRTELPGPRSRELHARAVKHMRGYSSQVKMFPVVFASGSGCVLTDVDGNAFIDFSSGIYVTNLGHCHPKVVEYTQKWTGQLMNCHDFTTEVKVLFLEKLAAATPGSLDGIQLFSAGTESVEAAMRAARVITKKAEFFSFWDDWHGKTTGSISLSSAVNTAYGPRIAGFHLAPPAYCYRCPFGQRHPECQLKCVKFLEGAIVKEGADAVAALVMEPIQGYGGTIVYPDDFLPAIRQLCDRLGILLIVDEVLTGLGRTGKMFCVDHYDVVPDILTFGKGLASGFPISAIAVKEEYAGALESMSASTSFGGNPMACAAALAVLEVFEEEPILEHCARLGKFILNRLQQMHSAHPIIGDVRGKGCLLGIELVKDKDTKEPFVEAGEMVYVKAFAKGLAWIPAKNILRLAPPINMDFGMAEKALDIIEESIAETERHYGYG